MKSAPATGLNNDLQRSAVQGDVQGRPSTLLLVTHVFVRKGPRGPQIDDQTAAGIAQWCRHFDRVTYYGIADDDGSSNGSSAGWVSLADQPGADRCTLLTLPRAYRVGSTLKNYRRVRATLAKAVAQHSHLCFTIGGLLGDWPAIGALESMKQRRRFSVWIDRVEPERIRHRLRGGSLAWRLVAAVALPLMERYTRHALRRSNVALLQGRDTFDHYARWALEAHCTYDTHTHRSDQIAPDALAAKQGRLMAGEPLRIVYVGRAAAMKGPMDWLDTLERLHRQGVPFSATWIGDGPELSTMKASLGARGLSDRVRLPGFEGNRDVLLKAMRESDVLLFCHKTAESPRCLIESLVSGCPLVGYESAYPRGLVEVRGGAVFAPQDDVDALAQRLADLHRDRPSLARLVADAAGSGELYTEDTVYAHRAALMRRA